MLKASSKWSKIQINTFAGFKKEVYQQYSDCMLMFKVDIQCINTGMYSCLYACDNTYVEYRLQYLIPYLLHLLTQCNKISRHTNWKNSTLTNHIQNLFNGDRYANHAGQGIFQTSCLSTLISTGNTWAGIMLLEQHIAFLLQQWQHNILDIHDAVHHPLIYGITASDYDSND